MANASRCRLCVLLACLAPSLASGASTGLTGGGQPFGNEQPSVGLRYLINIGAGDAADLGEVALFGATSARPFGWVEAQGQLLDTGQYPELFDLLDTTHGGNGTTTFALPNLRGRTAIGAGNGPGLPAYSLGQAVGTNTIDTLTNVAPHGHQLGSGLMTTVSGFSQTHSNLQPSLALTPIIATSGIFPSQNVVSGSLSSSNGPQPIGSGSNERLLGEVAWLAHDTIPAGWARADGAVLPINQNQALFSILGTTYGGDGENDFALPDLRGRAVLGAEGFGDLGDVAGAASEVMTLDKLPTHTHELPYGLGQTGPAGGSQPQSHLQPTQKLTPIVATTGLFPSEFATEGDPDDLGPAAIGHGSEPYLSSVTYFAGSFAPRGWTRADGKTLSIAPNVALFSLLGIAYGGDGRTNFRVPDLEDRLAVGRGNGPGLRPIQLGEQFGVEQSTLTLANLPVHNHGFTLPADYNNDGRVDAADYTVWRNGVGQPAGWLSNDVDGGPIGEAQYQTWVANYGKTIELAAPGTSVPEPGCVAIALGGGLILAARRRLG